MKFQHLFEVENSWRSVKNWSQSFDIEISRMITFCGHLQWWPFVVVISNDDLLLSSRMMTFCGHLRWWPLIFVVIDDLLWSSRMMTFCCHLGWWLFVVISDDDLLRSSRMMTFCGHLGWWPFGVISDDHLLWLSRMMMAFCGNLGWWPFYWKLITYLDKLPEHSHYHHSCLSLLCTYHIDNLVWWSHFQYILYYQ